MQSLFLKTCQCNRQQGSIKLPVVRTLSEIQYMCTLNSLLNGIKGINNCVKLREAVLADFEINFFFSFELHFVYEIITKNRCSLFYILVI